MLYGQQIWLGTTSRPSAVTMLPSMANRHGLIAGATGTGKTVTLQVLAEGFSSMGVPVFMADVKGDLSGMAMSGEGSEKVSARIQACGVPRFDFRSFPVTFWDLYGEQGHPVRATVLQMGPILLSRMLGLNETQSGVLSLVFRIADDEHMLMLDMRDLKAVLQYIGENAAHYTLTYGNIATSTIGAIQRAITVLEDQGGDRFFGEPALEIQDWLRVTDKGEGMINILAADRLFRNPGMYSTFMLWLLSEVYESMPEVGDLEKPRLVFFFDEAHLLFNGCPKSLLEKIQQMVRLIRSKGVGVFFITQSPSDLPVAVLGQLGNRVQHALRAYTPLDMKAVRIAAQTFRPNPEFDTEEAITGLQTGEALISFLEEGGAPAVVQRATILPPQSQIGILATGQRRLVIEGSDLFGKYDQVQDRRSAYEILAGTVESAETYVPDVPSLVYAPEADAPMEETPSLVYQATMAPPAAQAAPPVMPPVSPAPVPAPSQGFMVFDPATGSYVQKELPSMTPLHSADIGAPAPRPASPVLEVPPAAPAPAPVTTQPVLVYDPATGQYRQQMVSLQLDPSTGHYAPVQQPQRPLNAREQEKLEKEAEKARKEQERKEKERLAEERRRKAEERREEAAARARKNDSVLGRIQNTVISTATREVTKGVTRGLMGSISSLFGGK